MQANLVNRAFPSASVASLRGGGVPRLIRIVFVSLGSLNRGEKALIYSTTAHRSSSARLRLQGGIGVPGIPRDTARNKSRSVGNCPVGVERSRYFASTKLRGFGRRNAAASPLPSPFAP